MAINLSKTDINRAAAKLNTVFKKADKSHGGIIDRTEQKFDGAGKAALNKLYDYANHVENGANADKFTTVSVTGAKHAMEKIATSLKNKADGIGDKDGRIDGTELKLLSETGKAFVRFAQALKNG